MPYNIPNTLRTEFQDSLNSTFLAGGNFVVVDVNSIKPTEDGGWNYPYKTIQAALNAMPAQPATSAAYVGYNVLIMPGVYPEGGTLTIPASGKVVLIGAGQVQITGNVLRTAIAPPFGPVTGSENSNILNITSLGEGGVVITGNLTLGEAVNVAQTVRLNRVELQGNLVVPPASVGDVFIYAKDGTFTGLVGTAGSTAGILVEALRCSFAGHVDLDKYIEVFDSSIANNTTWTFQVADSTSLMKNVSFGTTVTVTGPAGVLVMDEVTNRSYQGNSVTLGGAASFTIKDLAVKAKRVFIPGRDFRKLIGNLQTDGSQNFPGMYDIINNPNTNDYYGWIPLGIPYDPDGGLDIYQVNAAYNIANVTADDVTLELATFDVTGRLVGTTGGATSYNEALPLRASVGSHDMVATMGASTLSLGASVSGIMVKISVNRFITGGLQTDFYLRGVEVLYTEVE